jgi:Carboxypeptidase regulatory-like domain
VAVLVLGLIAHRRAQTAAADQPAAASRPQPVLGGAIEGQVSDAATGMPIRRAHVRAMRAGERQAGEIYTDEHGRYELINLPPGRYVVTARKNPYLELAYGQTRPEQSAQPVIVGSAETVRGVDLKLPLGGVISGRVIDEYGGPVAYADVTVMRLRFVNEQYAWIATGPSARTDDLGEYRIVGLEPVEYLVAATYRPDAAVEREDASPNYGMTYAPGTLRGSNARRVTIGVGDSKDHVNIALVRVESARIAGVAYDAVGRPITKGQVSLYNRANPFSPDDPVDIKPDGSFVLRRIAPGEYTLEAEGSSQPDGPNESAIASLVVSGHDVDGIRLAPPPYSQVSGKILVDGGAAASLQSASIYLFVGAIDPHVIEVTPPRGQLTADLKFFALVPPGLRNVRLAGLPLGLGMRAIRLDGVDITDAGFDVKPHEPVQNIEVELTAHPTRVTGTVTDRRGAAAGECPVMIFARENRKWGDVRRYVARAATDPSGRFEVSGLPPGRYSVAAGYGIRSLDWNNDPDLLKRLRTRAGTVSLREGQTTVVTLKILGGS